MKTQLGHSNTEKDSQKCNCVDYTQKTEYIHFCNNVSLPFVDTKMCNYVNNSMANTVNKLLAYNYVFATNTYVQSLKLHFLIRYCGRAVGWFSKL